MDINEIKTKFRITTPIKVRYSDLDTLNHVNNASYLSYLEEARIDYVSKVLDFNKETLEFGVVVAHIDIDYLSPVLLSDNLLIYTRCSRIGNKSITFESVFIKNDHEFSARSGVVLVCVDREGNSVPVNSEWRERLEEFEK